MEVASTGLGLCCTWDADTSRAMRPRSKLKHREDAGEDHPLRKRPRASTAQWGLRQGAQQNDGHLRGLRQGARQNDGPSERPAPQSSDPGLCPLTWEKRLCSCDECIGPQLEKQPGLSSWALPTTWSLEVRRPFSAGVGERQDNGRRLEMQRGKDSGHHCQL